MEEEMKGGEDVQDISNSIAYKLLDELIEDGKITRELAQKFKEQYARMHASVLEMFESEKRNLNEAKKLNQELLGEKINLEKLNIRKHEESQVLQNLEKERDAGKKELDECHGKMGVLQYELVEAQRKYSELTRYVDHLKKQSSDLVEPEIKAVTDEIEELERDLAEKQRQIEIEARHREGYSKRAETLQQERQDLQHKRAMERQALSKIKMEPDRIKKQAEIVETAAGNLTGEVDVLTKQLGNAETELQQLVLKKKEVNDVCRDLTRKLDLHRTTIEQRERDVDAVRKSLELERNQHQDYLSQRVQLELMLRDEKNALKLAMQELSAANKDFELQKKHLRNKMQQLDSLKATIPQIENIVSDTIATKQSYENENNRYQKQIEALKQEVDVFIANYLRQENLEKDKRNKLEDQISQVKEVEAQVALWVAEENRQGKQIAMLSAQREIKSREASKAAALEKAKREELKVKELGVFDLTKKCTEMNNRLREFSALYDVVKNERNKYVNLIQASSQALAEMKEKIKILQNEVEILRNESLAKDRALAKERLAHQTAQCQRDAARLETNKCHAIYREKQDQVEQQIVEIDKLNSIINSMEKEMLRLKKQYELSVEQRNYTGVQLIDRNDELCILYEKSNVQEQTLKEGEKGLRRVEEDIRTLTLQTAEMKRKIELTRRHLLEMPKLAEKILVLKREFNHERELAEKLCEDLETPQNRQRWRALDGEDPDIEQLAAKSQVLEERLNQKKEQLLEKELVLEEVTELAEKLKIKANEGKKDTLDLAMQVNHFQARIKEMTQSMMATVAELSMYQATAMKLEQEKHEREKEYEESEWRFRNDQPPSEDAANEWYRMERNRIRVEEQARARSSQRLRSGQSSDPFSGKPIAKRTTAPQRPNAYIPDDDLGVPKPYGAHAPFKPSEPGTAMRHIRNPQVPEIEI